MIKTEEEIVNQIATYIQQRRGLNRAWFVGVAEHPRERLFEAHGVDERGEPWIFQTAKSAEAADTAAGRLHELGCDGAGRHETPGIHVYAYRKTTNTTELPAARMQEPNGAA